MLIGIVCNEWSLAKLFSQDGNFGEATRWEIRIFGLTLIIVGLVLINKKLKKFLLCKFHESKLFSVLLLAVIGVAIQLILWISSEGLVVASLGDDSGGYVFLALEALDIFGTDPVWDIRTPGWPLTIAALLSLVGMYKFWIISLFQRIVLGFIPVLFYLILYRYKKSVRVCFFLSLLTFLLPINRFAAQHAMTEILYVFTSLVALDFFANLQMVGKKRSLFMLSGAGIFLALHTAIRLQGLPEVIIISVFILAYFTAKKSFKSGVIACVIIIAPTIAFITALSIYNKQVSGTGSLSIGAASVVLWNFQRNVGSENPIVPQTPEISRLRELLPEVPSTVGPIHDWPNWHIGAFRAQQLLDMNSFEFSRKLGKPVTIQFIWANKIEFIKYVWRSAILEFIDTPSCNNEHKLNRFQWLLKWLCLLVPEECDQQMGELRPKINTIWNWRNDLPFPKNNLAYTHPRVTNDIWRNIENHWEKAEFRAFKLSEPFKKLIDPEEFRNRHSLIRELYFNATLNLFFLYSGIIGLICMLIMIVMPRLHLLGSIILVFYGTYLFTVAFVGGDFVTFNRYQWQLETLCLLATVVVLSQINWRAIMGKFLKGRMKMNV